MSETTPVRKLVLLPGMDGTGKLFAPFVEALGPGFEAVPISYPADRALSYGELGEYVSERLPKSEPFVLLAESFSTPLAVQIAATRPEGLSALILVAGFVTGPRYPWLPEFGALLLRGKMRLRLPDLALRRTLLGPAVPQRLLQGVRDAVLSMSAEVFGARLKAISGCDARAELARVAVPILYLQATNDRVVKQRSLNEILAIRPDVEVAKIEGPHLLLQREPHRAVDVIVRFLGGLR